MRTATLCRTTCLNPGWLNPSTSAHLTTSSKSRGNSNVFEHKLPHPLSKKGIDASQNIRTAIAEFSPAPKLPEDLISMNRIVGVLSLDLPKRIACHINKYIPSFSNSREDQARTSSKEDTLQIDAQETNGSINATSSTQNDLPTINEDERRKLTTAKLRLNAHNPVCREQHDFEQAMSDAYISSTALPQTPESTKLPVSTSEKHTVGTSTIQGIASTITSSSNLFKQISRIMPGRGPDTEPKVQKDDEMQRAILKRENLARSSAERKTKGLVIALRASTTNVSRLRRLEELTKHLAQHPNTKSKAVKEKAVPCLLKLRVSRDEAIQELSMEALALTGYIDPIRGRGIRILTLDGGGTRGLASIEILKRLEEECGQELHKMFDYVCGVSTGSLIGIMAAAFRVPLNVTEKLYEECSTEMFSRNKLMGVGKLFMSHSYYDAGLWEKVLHENIGFKSFLETTRDPLCPKIAAVSCLMNLPKLQNYIFKNYSLPNGVQSHYLGSTEYKLWEAIRASSAAPGYFIEAKMGNLVHQDGGLLTNNPTAIAIHECKLLWPNDSIQCVVSVGTGKYEPTVEPNPADPNNLKNKLTKVVQSATDTEAVHCMLNDLLPPSTYFRFNPYLSEEFELDEIRPDKWQQMKHDTLMYCRKNEQKMKLAASTLLKTKLPHQKVIDQVKLKIDSLV